MTELPKSRRRLIPQRSNSSPSVCLGRAVAGFLSPYHRFGALARLALAALLFGGLLDGFLLGGFAAADFFRGVHSSAAFFGAAVADGLVVAAVVEAVVVGDFFAGGDFTDGFDPDAVVLFVGFAVGVATVVDEHGHGVAVDDHRTVAESKEIGDGRVLVGLVGLVFAEAGAGILGDTSALADGGGGVAAGGVNGGGTDDECHADVRCFPWVQNLVYGPHRTIEEGMRGRGEAK